MHTNLKKIQLPNYCTIKNKYISRVIFISSIIT